MHTPGGMPAPGDSPRRPSPSQAFLITPVQRGVRTGTAVSPGPLGFPASWCVWGSTRLQKGWILSQFLLLLSPSNPFLLNLAFWLYLSDRLVAIEGLPHSGGGAQHFGLFSIRADWRERSLCGSLQHHHATTVGPWDSPCMGDGEQNPAMPSVQEEKQSPGI